MQEKETEREPVEDGVGRHWWDEKEATRVPPLLVLTHPPNHLPPFPSGSHSTRVPCLQTPAFPRIVVERKEVGEDPHLSSEKNV